MDVVLHTASTVAVEFWGVLGEMAPYLLFGFLCAGLLSVLIAPETVERHLGGDGIWPVVKAAAFGVPLPLCSCGVIPVSASLRRHGASRGATTAFLLSTPQTGVDSILVTFSLLGGAFALFRPLAALATGLLGGWLVNLLVRNGTTSSPSAAVCQDACCAPGAPRHAMSRAMHYGFVALPRDIGRPLLGGLAIAGLISAIVPKDYFAGMLGGGIGAMLVMMVLGIPVYVCATASVPVAATLILHAGVSPGAAFVFLMTGPATNAATIITVWKVMGRRTALIYLGTVAVCALAGGVLLDYILQTSGAAVAPHAHGMLPGWVNVGAALVLLAVLAQAFWPRRRASAEPEADADAASRTATLTVTGMTCSHCAASVRRALLECPGVETATVDLPTGIATVSGPALDPAALSQAVASLGYGAHPTGPPPAVPAPVPDTDDQPES